MKNSKRKNSRVAWVMLIVFCMTLFMTACGSAENSGSKRNSYNMKVTDATSDFYVNDFAGLFTPDQKTAMMANAISLDEEYGGIQVVVTTVESLEGCVKEKSALQSVSVETVAYSMFLQYGIGQDDMGILVLFSTGDREVRIETGKQMQNYITDSKSGQILDNYGMDYFRNDQFAEGLVAVQNAVISEIKTVVPQDWNAGKEEVTRGKAVAPTEQTKNDKPVSTEPQPDKVQSDVETKKSGDTGVMTGIISLFIALFAAIAGIILGIKKLSATRNELEKTKRKLNEQKKAYNSQIEKLKAQHEEEIESRTRELKYDYELSLNAQSAEADRQFKELRGLIDSKESQIKKKNEELFSKSKQIIDLDAQLKKLQDKFARAQKLHPDCDFEAEVEKMIEDEFRAEAERVDKSLTEYLDNSADKDLVSMFARGLNLYDSVKPEVAKYLKSDRSQLYRLYNESVRLKEQYEKEQKEKRERAAADAVYHEINDLLTSKLNGVTTGTYQNYELLTQAMKKYNQLSDSEKQYFPDKNLIRNVEIMQRDAAKDHDDRNKGIQAENEVQRILGGMYSASESDLDKLERAMRVYRNLTSAQQAYFAADLLRKLKKFIDDAEEDHRYQEERRRREAEERRRREEEARRRREEEERRRRREAEERRRREEEEERRRRMSSSSFGGSSFGGSGFGGHGGGPSGGGASRGF